VQDLHLLARDFPFAAALVRLGLHAIAPLDVGRPAPSYEKERVCTQAESQDLRAQRSLVSSLRTYSGVLQVSRYVQPASSLDLHLLARDFPFAAALVRLGLHAIAPLACSQRVHSYILSSSYGTHSEAAAKCKSMLAPDGITCIGLSSSVKQICPACLES
jgi:hypothetical protein